MTTTFERLEGVVSLATDLLTALRPWELQPPEVRSAATRLTVALAALPLVDDGCPVCNDEGESYL